MTIFGYLVTPSGTKIAYNTSDLAAIAKCNPIDVAEVTQKLSQGQVRVLRPLDPSPVRPGEPRYEIFHDVLAPAILDWRARRQEKLRRVLSRTTVTLAGSLFSVFAFLIIRSIGFLNAPPRFEGSPDFVLSFATLCSGLICALVLWKKDKVPKLNTVATSVVLLLAFVTVSSIYNLQRSMWSVDIGGQSFLIGDKLTRQAKESEANQTRNAIQFMGDFAFNADMIWEPEGLRWRQLLLGSLYVFSAALLGLWGSSIVLIVLRSRSVSR